MHHYLIKQLIPFTLFGLLFQGCKNEPIKIASNPPIKIGILAPYHGPGYRFLTELHRGLDLAFHNAGDFHLIYENSDTSGTHGKMAIKKLIDKDRVFAIFGGDNPDVVRKTADACYKAKVIYFPALLPLPELIEKNPYVFSILPSLEQLAGTLIDFCQQKSIGRNVSVLYEKDSYHLLTANLLRDALLQQNYQVSQFIDYTQATGEVTLDSSDLVFLLTGYEATLPALTWLRSINFKGPVIGSILSVRHPIRDSISDQEYYYPQLHIDKRSRYFRNFTKAFREFHHRISTRFPELFEDDPNLLEAQVYESAQFLIDAIREAGPWSEAVYKYLLSDPVKSLTGQFQFDSFGRTVRKFEMVQLVDGKTIVIR